MAWFKRKSKSSNKKLAYYIACYKNPEQVLRLIKAIYHKDNLFFINIDEKSPDDFYETIISSQICNQDNIHFSRKRIDWAQWNQVQVTLDVIKKALATDGSWTHFINLSGQDFPLKSQIEIQDYLLEVSNKSFLSASYYPPETEMAAVRFSAQSRIDKLFKMYRRLDLLNPEIKFYKGSQWMILSRDFCKYADGGRLSKKLKPLFKKVQVSDESFFPTLAANCELSSTIVWDDKRFIDWTLGGPHPAVLDLSYLEKISLSPAFFARKFDENVDAKIITALESSLER